MMKMPANIIDKETLSTRSLARKVKHYLKSNRISWEKFSRLVLGVGSEKLGELLTRPEPWDTVEASEKVFYRRMELWMESRATYGNNPYKRARGRPGKDVRKIDGEGDVNNNCEDVITEEDDDSLEIFLNLDPKRTQVCTEWKKEMNGEAIKQDPGTKLFGEDSICVLEEKSGAQVLVVSEEELYRVLGQMEVVNSP